MKTDLLEILCCPQCEHALTLRDADPRQAVVLEGSLACDGCGAQYPIVRGIPRFVPHDGYVGSFSYEWNKWNRVQVDSANGSRVSEETFAHKTGFAPSDLANKWVLDVGCGAGRFLDVASRWGGRAVGVDFSYAVEAAQNNVGGRANVDVVQADVFHLPFRREVFDVIFSLGVLHHTRDTREAFLSLPRHLKEGGLIAVWLYYYTDWLYNRASDFWRGVLRPLPNRAIYAWSALLCAVCYPLFRQPFMRTHPFSLLLRMLPVNLHEDWHWRVLDTFDWYSPRYQDKDCSPVRVTGWCREGGLREVELLEFPTSIRAVKDSQRQRPLLKTLPDFRNKRIVIFGAGAGGQQALDRLAAIGLAQQVVAVVDNDPAKKGQRLGGHLVTAFDDVPRDAYDHVVIASMHGLPAIATQLSAAGLVKSRDFFASGMLEEFAPLLRLASA